MENICTFLFVLFATIYSINCELKATLTDAVVNIDDAYFSKPIIKLNNNPTDSSVDIEGSALQLINDPWMRATLLVDGPDGLKTFLTTPKQNLCEFFKAPEKIPLLKMIYDDIGKYGNFSTSCPIEKGFYYLHGFKIDGSKIPPMAPTGKYRLDMEMLVVENGADKQIYEAQWSATLSKI